MQVVRNQFWRMFEEAGVERTRVNWVQWSGSG